MVKKNILSSFLLSVLLRFVVLAYKCHPCFLQRERRKRWQLKRHRRDWLASELSQHLSSSLYPNLLSAVGPAPALQTTPVTLHLTKPDKKTDKNRQKTVEKEYILRWIEQEGEHVLVCCQCWGQAHAVWRLALHRKKPFWQIFKVTKIIDVHLAKLCL